MKKLTSIGVLVFALAFTTTALSWDSFGHMEVAAVAYGLLTPNAKTEVAKLLKLNPDYSTWVAGVAASKKNKTAFVKAATWADAIKSKPNYTNDPATGPHASDNKGYTDKRRHRYWHFVDLPFSPDGTALVQPVAPNALTQIETFRTTLASTTATNKVKSYDLVWLEHLVGDVHQPLHATSRFTTQQPQGDHGGNLVTLCALPCKHELHGFWDTVLGTSTTPSSAITAANALPAANTTAAAVTDVHAWLDESEHLAETQVYVAPVGNGPGPFTVDAAYQTNATAVAKDRVALAGARLAKLINDAFN